MKKREAKQIAVVDFDEAYTVGNETDTVYFTVARNRKGWWMTAIIDCDTANFIDSLCVDDGPYKTEKDALWGGMNCAGDWMINNKVTDYQIDDRIKKALGL